MDMATGRHVVSPSMDVQSSEVDGGDFEGFQRPTSPSNVYDSASKFEFEQHLEHMRATGDKMMAMLEKDFDATLDVDAEVKKCLAVVQSMVDDGLIEDCSPIWCYAVSLIKSDSSRSILVNLSTNAKRHAWLKSEFAQNVA